jgi:hypothetical protein
MEKSRIDQVSKIKIEKSNESSLLEKQELYKKIQAEIETVLIEKNDRDLEGNLLAPNGKKSNLPEQEWKMTRTPSFLKSFGNWKEKYNKEQYDLWLKYQEKQTCEDYIKKYQEYQKKHRSNLLKFDLKEYAKDFELRQIDTWQKDIIRLSHKVSKLHAELINAGFNLHSYDLDYAKVLDENGEPLLLVRGTDFAPDEHGKFVIPKKEIEGKEYEVGVFFGKESEAKFHLEGRKKEGKIPKLYKAFVNGRNFRVFDSKPHYWNDPSDHQGWQEKYDGLWVKENSEGDTHNASGINMMDYVCFDPNEILIVGVE